MNPLRVLHLRTSDRFGGPERLILDQALLASPDFEVLLASFGAPTALHPFLDRAREAGAEVIRVAQSGSYDPRAIRRVKTTIEDFRPDVLVGHDYKADLALSLAAYDRPRVAMVHGYTSEDTKIRIFEAIDRQVLRSFAAVVVVADPLREQLVLAGVPSERIHVVPNGVSADRVAAVAHASRAEVRREWGLSDADRAVVVLGRLSPEKGQDVALEAFAGLARGGTNAPLCLVLVGDGVSREGLEARAARDDLAERVHFAGWRNDPWRCLGAADVFLLPSRSEGLPLALLEAMAAGVPVVATDVGAVGEVLGPDGERARLIPAGDALAMRSALEDLLGDDAKRERLARAAALRVREAYGIERQVRALETIWRDAAAGSRSKL